MVVKTLRHKCAVESCETFVEERMLMCKEHWFKVPEATRMAVSRHFKWGPWTKYLDAREKAIASVPIPAIPKNPQMVLR